MTNKPIVHFDRVSGPIIHGLGAYVWPWDHPNGALVSNVKCVHTSPVVKIKYGVGGIVGFDTHNTRYRVKARPANAPQPED